MHATTLSTPQGTLKYHPSLMIRFFVKIQQDFFKTKKGKIKI